jgi:hypothetical protein
MRGMFGQLPRDEAALMPRCPHCGAQLAWIQYGFPDSVDTPPNVVLGGCVVTGDDPGLRCPSCGTDVWEDGRFAVPAETVPHATSVPPPDEGLRRRTARILERRDDDNFLRIDLRVDDTGFVIDAHDIGDFAERYWGRREYEWTRTVAPAHLDALRTRFGGGPADDLLELAVAWCEANDPYDLDRFVRESDVPSTFESWHTD